VGPDRGIVDQNVDAAELGQCPRRHRVDLISLGNVGDHGESLEPKALGFAHDGVDLRLIRACVDEAPSPASFNAVARPILRPEPVTRATFPSSLPISPSMH
jgi:hypothetical protein